MLSIALTGGIATGKSSFARVFLELAPRTRFFDCDACVHELLLQPQVIQKICAAFEGVQSSDGSVDRTKLRAQVFENPARRHVLESILHPLVRSACAAAQAEGTAQDAEFFMADVPLLYESGFPMPRDLEIVVATSPAEQLRRLIARSRLKEELAGKIIAAQLPILEKVRRAGVVIWNGGTPPWMSHQTVHLVAWLRQRRGSGPT